MSTDLADVAAFAAVLSRYAPKGHSAHSIGQDATSVSRDAALLHKLAEHDCNRGLTPAEQAREEKIQTRITNALAMYGAEPEFGGDPRGSVVKVKMRGGESHNDWGGTGLWCL